MGGKILVIEDHPQMRDVLANFLGTGDHQVTLCSDGASALERLTREPFDLVVTDLRLPDLPGLAIVQRAKQLRPTVPVAVITGAGDLVPGQDLGRHGIDYLLAKPFSRQQFLKVVASALGQPV